MVTFGGHADVQAISCPKRKTALDRPRNHCLGWVK